jgi:hypothetical protein
MSLSSLVATLGYYPLPSGIFPSVGGGGVPVDFRKEREELPKPLMIVKKVESIDIPVGVEVSIVSVKSI